MYVGPLAYLYNKINQSKKKKKKVINIEFQTNIIMITYSIDACTSPNHSLDVQPDWYRPGLNKHACSGQLFLLLCNI